jgi:hemolysin-activating ACP:hemolysin acyltransferase
MIANAFDPDNKDPYAYLKWAFINPDGEKDTIVDANKDPSLI